MVNDFGSAAVAPRVNRFAVVALCCGVAGIFVLPFAGLAIMFGHIARSEARRTGEGGRRPAAVGLILGYGVLGVGIAFYAFMYWMLYLSVHAPKPAWIPAPRGTASGR